MTREEDRWDYIVDLDEELLQGGVILSEWTTFLVRDADRSFCAGAPLVCILVCQAALESHLRFEYFDSEETEGWGFARLIRESPIPQGKKDRLHELRKLRNEWVHVGDPEDDDHLLEQPQYEQKQLERSARRAIRLLREVLYLEPWI